jgi:hypothetical protein
VTGSGNEPVPTQTECCRSPVGMARAGSALPFPVAGRMERHYGSRFFSLWVHYRQFAQVSHSQTCKSELPVARIWKTSCISRRFSRQRVGLSVEIHFLHCILKGSLCLCTLFESICLFIIAQCETIRAASPIENESIHLRGWTPDGCSLHGLFV